MKKLTDDLINGYIDNELNQSEIDLVNKIISEDPAELQKLKAHQFVNQELRQIGTDKAPSNISQIIMEKITNTISVKNEKPYFLFGVLGFFGVAILSVVIFLLTNSTNGNPKQSYSKPVFDEINSFLSSLTPSLSLLIDSANLILIGFSLTLILIIGFILMVGYQKQLLEKLNSFGH